MKRRNFLIGVASLPALLLPRWFESVAKPLPPKWEPISKEIEIHVMPPRWNIYTGGPGSGKTTRLLTQVLTLLREGNSGVLLAPSWHRMTVCTWPQLQRMVPSHWVVPHQRDYLSRERVYPPRMLKVMNNKNDISCLYMTSYEDAPFGFNATFAGMDDVDPFDPLHQKALIYVDGRVRIPMTHSSSPAIFVTADDWPRPSKADSPVLKNIRKNARILNLEKEEAWARRAATWTNWNR